jgi:hypothetical protein
MKRMLAMIRTVAVVLLLVVAIGVAAPRNVYGATIYDSIDPWYTNTANYDPAKCATITNQASLDTLRASLISYLWKGNGLPTALPSTIWQNATPPIPITDNFLRADRMEIIRTTPGGVRFFYHLYVFRPIVKSSNRVSIVSSGHNSNMDATGIGPTIRALVSAGITVVGTWMPCNGENYDEWGNYPTHDAIGTLESANFAAVTLFIDHLIVALNQMQAEGMGPFSMIGVSGGGWTTTILAAVDTRIKLSYDVAGSEPIAVRSTGPSATALGDWEQNNGLGVGYSKASYEDLYILGSAGAGRRHVQALNRIDPQCFWGIYYQLWQPLITARAATLGGQYAVHSYDYVLGGPVPGIHFLDSSTLNLYLADLGVVAAAPNITAQPVNVAVTAGQTATFGVTATGTAPLTYQWMENGTNISGATAASYTTPATSLADSGTTFSVVVSNSVSNVTSNSAVLTVTAANAAPIISAFSPANPVTVAAGTTQSFSVSPWDADGDALSYAWKIDGATVPVTINAMNYSPTSADAGSHSIIVTVSDGKGGTVSQTWAVTVTTASSATAAFVQADTATQGSWKGKYGADGYNVIANATSYPVYATVSASGKSDWTWNGSTADVRALQKAGAATDRISACWFSGGSFTVDVNLTDGGTHRLAFYCLDGDTNARRQRVEVLDAGSGAVLDTQNLNTPFDGGVYLVWDIRGHVNVTFTCTGPYNAVLSGLFFGGSGSTPVPPAITAQPAGVTVAAGQTATFSVTATGTAPFSYQWMKNGTNISGATSASYTTPATSLTDSGSAFSVVVTNSAGSVTSNSAVLTVTVLSSLVISNVTASSGQVYQVDVLHNGKLIYIDRTYTFVDVSNYDGAQFIRTANNDKASTGNAFVMFAVNVPVTVFVAHDDRITTKPSWLGAFVDTGDNLTIAGVQHSLYKRDFPAGTVTLGGNDGPYGSMYSVVIKDQTVMAPMLAAASVQPTDQFIDLGTISPNTKVRLTVPLPENLSGAGRIVWKTGSGLPRGLRCSRGNLSGKTKVTGDAMFTVTFKTKTPVGITTIEQQYRLTVAP